MISASGGAQGRVHVEHVMGMAITVDVRDEVGDDAIDDLVAWFHHVDHTFSTYLEDSPISQLGRGDIGLGEVSDEVRGVLRLCEQIRADSDGVFDIFAVPAPNGTTLDPSGLVKGWSVEVAAGLLEAHGARNFSINAGGDIALRGDAEPGTPWRVGIRHPEHPDRLATVVTASGPLGVATSATYERGAHIVDPRTGTPTTALASATVVGPDLTFADAYATVVFVLGEDGLEWLAGHDAYDAYVITHDDMTRWTPGFARFRDPAADA